MRHPVGRLRMAWIARNQSLDRKEELDVQLELIKLHGFYNNPEWYFAVEEDRKQKRTNMSTGFLSDLGIDVKSDFKRRIQATMRGEETREHRPDIAEKVQARRAGRSVTAPKPELTEEAAALIEEYEVGDTLTITRKGSEEE